jgi:hypothetical protein
MLRCMLHSIFSTIQLAVDHIPTIVMTAHDDEVIVREGASSVWALHGSLTYRDDRWADADAAALIEVIEHLDPDRLPPERVVFGEARPATVVVTTPNAEYNALFPNLAAGAFRHPDHRFEWTRAEFQAWADRIGSTYGYRSMSSGIGRENQTLGAPTQMAVFTR